MKKVLFLSAWYPHRYDAMSGLFVRKHADSVADFVNVCVLFLYADSSISDFEFVIQKTGNITEVYVYYPFVKACFAQKISKIINFIRSFFKGYAVVKKQFGVPDIIHVNVLTRLGVMAYLMNKVAHIPYVITEHWSRYFKERNSYKGWFRQKTTEIVVKNAHCVMPVSQVLEQEMKRCNLHHANYQVIGNVVDDIFFSVVNKTKRLKKRIIHVSCFDDEVKNISGIIRTINSLSKKRSDFELVIIGNGVDFEVIRKQAETLDLLDKFVFFEGEQSSELVAEWMKRSDFFVLFSNCENAPVVVSEALACGLPVVSTSVGAVPQMITSDNGLIVPVRDECALCSAIDWMLDNYQFYEEDKIRSSASGNSSKKIGTQINSIYESI